MTDRSTDREWLSSAAEQVPTALVQFGLALDQAEVLVDGWPYFLEKPWKWESEFAAWQSCGEPHAGDPGWDTFLTRLEEIGL